MKKLLALLATLFSCVTHAATCTIDSYSAAVFTTDAFTAPLVANLPPTYHPGSILLFFSKSYPFYATSTLDPAGYTLAKAAYAGESAELWAKIAGPGETAPSIKWWDSPTSAFVWVVALSADSSGGFKNAASVVGDSTADYNVYTAMTYPTLTITQGGACTLHFSSKYVDNADGVPTGVAVTSGWDTLGNAIGGSYGLVGAGERFNGTATGTLDWMYPAVIGNNTNSYSGGMTLTLLYGDNNPNAFTLTDQGSAVAGAQYTSNEITVAGQDNYSPYTVSGTSCEISASPYAVWGTSVLYLQNGDKWKVRGNANATPAGTRDCVVSAGSTPVTDTYTITTSAGAYDERPFRDTFIGTNGANVAGHAADHDAATSGWTKVPMYTGGSAGAATIQSNAANIATSTLLTDDQGVTDYEVDCDWTPTAAQTNDFFPHWRMSDTDNYWAVEIAQGGGYSEAQMSKSVGGQIVYFPQTNGLVTLGNTYKVRLMANGNQIGYWIDGTSHHKVITDSDNNTRTKFGIGTGSLGVTQVVDNCVMHRTHTPFQTSTGRVSDDPKGFYLNQSPSVGSFWWFSDYPTHATLIGRNGGGWKFTNDGTGENFNGVVYGYDSSTTNLDSATLPVNATNGTAAPAWTSPQTVTWAKNVSQTTDLTTFMTNRGSPPATCALQSGVLVAGKVLDTTNCAIGGAPSQGYTATQVAVIRATNASGTADLTLNQIVTGDALPDAASVTFIDVQNAVAATPTACPALTPTGADVPYLVQIAASPDTGCEFKIDAGAYGTSSQYFIPGTNTTITARVTSGSAGQSKRCPMDFGGVMNGCDVTTQPDVDTQPDPFQFQAVTTAALGSPQEACTQLNGFTNAAAVTASGGTCTTGLSVQNGGTPSTNCGNTTPPSSLVCAQHTASMTPNTPTNTTVCVSGQCATFTSTTRVILPSCTDIPVQVVDEGSSGSLDVAPFCTNVVSWSGPAVPFTGASLTGSVITYNNIAPPEKNVALTASSAEGTRNVNVVFQIRSASQVSCTMHINGVLSALGIGLQGAIGQAVRNAICTQ